MKENIVWNLIKDFNTVLNEHNRKNGLMEPNWNIFQWKMSSNKKNL